MEVSAKPVVTVLVEAVVVGVLFVAFVHVTLWYVMPLVPNVSGNKGAFELFLVAGFLFHVVSEYTGLNMWYARGYCELL